MENAPQLGFLLVVLVYNHFTFNKYQKNITRLSEEHSKSLAEAYEDANKGVIDRYKEVIKELRKHVAYLNEEREKADAKANRGGKGRG